MKLALLAFVAGFEITAAMPTAAAKSSFTPPVGVDAMTTANCMVQNVGTKARTVTAVLRNQSGGEVGDGIRGGAARRGEDPRGRRAATSASTASSSG